MNGAADTDAERVQRLLAVVEQQRDRRCEELLQQARHEASQLVQQARYKARQRLHREILRARQQFSHQLLVQQAGQAARERQARFGQERVLLDLAWQRLQDNLVKRWQDAAARQRWVETLVEHARARLVQRGWRVEHPADWPAAEREALAGRLREWLDESPEFEAVAALRAGLRVRAGDTLVDGSAEGLLRDRTRIEAQLLTALRETPHG